MDLWEMAKKVNEKRQRGKGWRQKKWRKQGWMDEVIDLEGQKVKVGSSPTQTNALFRVEDGLAPWRWGPTLPPFRPVQFRNCTPPSPPRLREVVLDVRLLDGVVVDLLSCVAMETTSDLAHDASTPVARSTLECLMIRKRML